MRSASRSQRPKSMIFPTGSEPDVVRPIVGREHSTRSKSRQETSTKEVLNDSDEDGEHHRRMAVLQDMLTKKDQSIYKITRDMNEVRADKDQLEKLFEGSQAENQKCVQQINDLKEHVKLLETTMNRLNGPGWREDFSIPPTPGPRSSISLLAPIPDLSDVSIRKRQSTFRTAPFDQRLSRLVEMSPGDDDTEEVIDSMRRYVRQDDNQRPGSALAGEDLSRQDLDQQLTELSILDDDPLPMPSDKVTHRTEDTTPTPPLQSQKLDLEPIISTLSTLHAAAHAQSADLLHQLAAVEAAKALERERLQDERNRSTLAHLDSIKATIQHDWEEMRLRDAVKEQELKSMMEKAMRELEILQRSEKQDSFAIDPDIIEE